MGFSSILIVLILGILSTVQLHLAKALERQGIEIFDQLRAKVGLDSNKEIEGGVKKPAIYIIGLILNNIEPIYPWIAGSYGEPPALFTSVFGLGLIALMLYSYFVLKEPLSRLDLVGAVFIILGTLMIGIDGINQPELNSSDISAIGVILVTIIYIFVGVIAVIIAIKKKNPLLIGLLFGLFAGGCGGLDSFYKNIGLNEGGTGGLLPSTPLGWFVFVASFAIAVTAFTFTQWGFAKGANASVLVPAYDCTYIALPVVFQLILLPGYSIDLLGLSGLIFILVGIILMRQLSKESHVSEKEENKRTTREDKPQITENA